MLLALKTEEIENILAPRRNNRRIGGLSDVLSDMVNKKVRISGVYCIEHISGRKYIGSSMDIGTRWRSHLNMLKAGRHTQRFQAAWDKYGAHEFIFRVLELVNDREKLIHREQYWIDKFTSYDEEYGFNTAPSADGTAGISPSWETRQKMSKAGKGRKFTEEHKKRIGLANKGKKRIPEMIARMKDYLTGRKLSEEHKAKIRESCKGINKGVVRSPETRAKLSKAKMGSKPAKTKLTEEQVKEIKQRLAKNEPRRKIARDYGVSKSSIDCIKSGRTWKWV